MDDFKENRNYQLGWNRGKDIFVPKSLSYEDLGTFFNLFQKTNMNFLVWIKIDASQGKCEVEERRRINDTLSTETSI